MPDTEVLGRRGRLDALAPILVAILSTRCVPDAHAEDRTEVDLAPLPVDDLDEDGLADSEEAELARRFAPIVVLDRRDHNRPASIGWLQRSSNDASRPSFVVPEGLRGGAEDPSDWTAYVHVYPRPDGGVNLQYWFFYPYNDGPLFFDHDSDWEHVTVRLDANRRAVGAHLARHADDHPGPFWSWSRLRRSGDHPIVLSALGSHATYGDARDVAWYDRAASCADIDVCADPIWRTWEGDLPNIGERRRPLAMADVLAYSGRWGRERIFPGTSAPFGPLHHRGFCSDAFRSCESVGIAGTLVAHP